MPDIAPQPSSWVQSFAKDGFHLIRAALSEPELDRLRAEFDALFDAHPSGVDQTILLTSPTFIELLHHDRIQRYAREVYGEQLQLLMYALRRGHPGRGGDRNWHRDFDFVTDRLIAMNMIVYLDPMPAADGATVVLPGSHRQRVSPVANPSDIVAGEIPVPAEPGDVLLNWSTLVHSGTPRNSGTPRRLVLLYFGPWWLKRYEHDRPVPWQGIVDAPQERLTLLGLRPPGRDLHVDTSVAGHPCL